MTERLAARPRGHIAAVAAPLVMEGVHRSIAAGVPGCLARMRVLAGVTLRVGAGELVAIIGAPGAGKSVLLQCAAGLARCDTGGVSWRGDAAAAAGRCYARAADLCEPHVRARAGRASLLLLDDADGARAAAVAAAWRARGVTVVAAARDGRHLAEQGARILELRCGSLSPPRAHDVFARRRALVAEPRGALR